MWVHIVSLLGRNPINITESFISVVESVDVTIRPRVINASITIFYTKDPQIKDKILPILTKIFEIVNQNPKNFYNNLNRVCLFTKELPIDDIRNYNDLIECIKVMGKEIKKRKEIREKKELYPPLFFFDVTSGRKSMSIILYILACIFEAKEVFQIVPTFEIDPYKINEIIERLYNSLYKDFLNVFINDYKDVFFPKTGIYKVHLPIIPFKKVKKIIQSIKSRAIDYTISENELSKIADEETVYELIKYGYLKKFGSNYKLTDLFEIFCDILKD